MRSSTAAPTRLPGRLLVIVLLAGSLILGPSPVSATGEADPVGVWPLSPAPDVVRRFDPPSAPWGSGHRGVDLLGHVGQPVLAALPGRVSFAGTLAGRGVVTVDHGDTRTTYEPVAATVDVGATVAAGGSVGALTSALSHCLPAACLHWGWIRNADDAYLDPLRLVGLVPVRLLPLWRDRPVNAGRGQALPAGLPASRTGSTSGTAPGVLPVGRDESPTGWVAPSSAVWAESPYAGQVEPPTGPVAFVPRIGVSG